MPWIIDGRQYTRKLYNAAMRLMISVVSVAEALEAQAGGASLLDVKNPHEGSLGAQFPSVVRAIRQAAGEKAELSVAIGDMPNLPGTAAMAALGAATCGADYIKVGLYGIHTDADSVRLLRAVKEAAGGFKTKVIAAAYADHQRIRSLDPRRLPGVAGEAGVDGCLIDTAIKDGSTLLDYLTAEDLAALVREAHSRKLLFGAAGALGRHHLPLLRTAEVDVAGLRTAVCSNGIRTGALEAGRVRALMSLCGGTVSPKA